MVEWEGSLNDQIGYYNDLKLRITRHETKASTYFVWTVEHPFVRGAVASGYPDNEDDAKQQAIKAAERAEGRIRL